MLNGTIRAQGKCTSDLRIATPHVPSEVTASDPEMEDHEDPDEEAPTLLSGGLSA